jgi:hypothetical protein
MPGYVEATLGGLVLIAVLHDLFQSIVLPRPSPGRWRLSPMILRPLWAGRRWVGAHIPRVARRENWLATFGHLAVIELLAFWVCLLTLGFGLLMDALRDQFQPHAADLWTSLYNSAATLFPLSFGDILPEGAGARVVTVAESATGVILIALVISLLFSLYRSFQEREELVVTLDALAGAPPSGVQMLEVVAKYKMPDTVTATFDDWRRWSAAVLESHVAYPILIYFRSSHDNEAWINSFGAVMDAATLVISPLTPRCSRARRTCCQRSAVTSWKISPGISGSTARRLRWRRGRSSNRLASASSPPATNAAPATTHGRSS